MTVNTQLRPPARWQAQGLPVVQEPTVRRCGHYAVLSGREGQALAMLAGDLNASQIAQRARWSYGSTLARLRELLRSLGAASWPQAVDVACRTGVLVPPPGRLTAPLPPSPLASFQAIAEGEPFQQVAVRRGITKATLGAHLSAIRYRARSEGNPAAVFRLHGVPGLLNASVPPCRFCRTAASV
ncbi:hypothetical protein ABTY61_32290 [Kitasatospora sp. NPDC096128]|uniref:hypothetical protein n=1 Tax=Kitasatospora sp. NPDC096128 TaxID=3155547 RepID=UPI00332B640A